MSYRAASRTLDALERKRLRTWVRRRLERGLSPEDITAELVRRGHNFEWAEAFVDRAEEKLAVELGEALNAEGNYTAGLVVCLVTGCSGLLIVFAVTRARQTRRGALHGTLLWTAVLLVFWTVARAWS